MVNHISELVAILPTFLEGRPVQDKTGLTYLFLNSIRAIHDFCCAEPGTILRRWP
jgi:hypothetical protein